jgi:hypothetical protein
MKKEKNTFQLIWGIALVMMGIGVFYRLPQVWPNIEQIDIFRQVLPFIRFCFYVMGIMLIGGGAKKIYDQLLRPDEKETKE